MNRITEGTMIEKRSALNTPAAMCLSREFDSNEIDLSDPHDEKHDDPRISTFRGISID
jgi:hypothetical protein